MGQLIVIATLSVMLVSHILYVLLRDKKYNRMIERQQDTIQKLLNREPVTYKEVGKAEPKEEEVRYSAWGSRMLTKDDYNKEQ